MRMMGEVPYSLPDENQPAFFSVFGCRLQVGAALVDGWSSLPLPDGTRPLFWLFNWLSESPSSGCRQHDQSTTVQSLAPPRPGLENPVLKAFINRHFSLLNPL